ncbi:hypothetical protein Asp14428_26490 [Actinoplanes sp. NBRC 14428]|nr:hypothetical protein Asp14428_26490 [Actinoplanes sp. NBRC 14428]
MRVLICPDKFAGTLSAPEAAAAVAEGWHETAPADDCVLRPLSDGGPGFVEVLAGALDGRRLPVTTTDPLGRPAQGEILLAGTTAYVESAQACGLHLLTKEERNPNTASSYGLGLLLAAAVEAGATEVVVGLGGSAVNDAGAGMLAALGAGPVDQSGYALPYGGAALGVAAGLAGLPQLREARLVAATDVDNPLLGLHGASNVYGPRRARAGRTSSGWTPPWNTSPAYSNGRSASTAWPRCPAPVRPAGSAPPCSPSAAGWCPASAWSPGSSASRSSWTGRTW